MIILETLLIYFFNLNLLLDIILFYKSVMRNLPPMNFFDLQSYIESIKNYVFYFAN